MGVTFYEKAAIIPFMLIVSLRRLQQFHVIERLTNFWLVKSVVTYKYRNPKQTNKELREYEQARQYYRQALEIYV